MKWHIKTIPIWKYKETLLPPNLIAGHVRMVYYKILWIRVPVAYYATGTFQYMIPGYDCKEYGNYLPAINALTRYRNERYWIKLKP